MFAGTGIDDGDGGWGSDILKGGPGGDFTLFGGAAGADQVFGGDGDDACLATVDAVDNDAIFGEPGNDASWADPGDERVNVERSGPCFAE